MEEDVDVAVLNVESTSVESQHKLVCQMIHTFLLCFGVEHNI